MCCTPHISWFKVALAHTVAGFKWPWVMPALCRNAMPCKLYGTASELVAIQERQKSGTMMLSEESNDPKKKITHAGIEHLL